MCMRVRLGCVRMSCGLPDIPERTKPHYVCYGMSAPPGFQMAASLAPWQSPAPQRHSIIERSTLHRSGARGAVDAAAAGVDCGDVPVAAPLMLMHLPVPAVHHTSVARTACASASAEVRSLPPPVSMETAVRSVPSTQRLAEVATDDQHGILSPVSVRLRSLSRWSFVRAARAALRIHRAHPPVHRILQGVPEYSRVLQGTPGYSAPRIAHCAGPSARPFVRSWTRCGCSWGDRSWSSGGS